MARTRRTTEQLASGNGVCAEDAFPGLDLGARPYITCEQDAVTAVRSLMWLKSRLETVETRAAQSVELIRRSAEEDLHLTVQGERIRLDQYAGRLLQAVQDWEAERS